MATTGKLTDTALRIIKNLPRVSLSNLKNLPESKKTFNRRRSRGKNKTHGRGHKGQGQRMTLPRLGFEGGNVPFYLQIPQEPYYKGHHVRREYPPLTLLQLQRMIDTNRIATDDVIDLTMICNTGLYYLVLAHGHFGVNLQDEGADVFRARVNIEVQWASELTIAAIEKNGGVITTRYYDPASLKAMINPERFFLSGNPIPRCKLPPHDAFEYYSSPANRGYLADPEKVAEARLELAQKYGYELPDMTEDPLFELMTKRKDPRQIFLGLEPGWIVNMKDKCILKPKSEEYQSYYAS